MSSLQPPRYLITGASSGIGEELARQLAEKGYTVGLIARRKERLVALKQELKYKPGKVFIYAVDLSNEAESTQAYNKLRSEMGGLDGIILNAAAYTHTSVGIGDAIKAIETPVIEVHISNTYAREEFRHQSFISPNAKGVILGFGLQSYELALQSFL